MNETEKLLKELNDLIMLDPDKAKAVFDAHPELTLPVLGELHKQDLAARVRHDDSPESWAAFCELIDGARPPRHVMRQIKRVYSDHKAGVGTVIHAFRGSRKTTYFDVKFMAYRIGKEPWKTNIVVGAVDDSPEKVTKSVAALIEFHPEWKRAFQNVVPDKERGWSLEGFFVKDTSTEYNLWVQKQASTLDPTLLGGGYESRRLNGKHPSGMLICDDIHDINNNSDKQRKDVVKALTTVILKTVIRKNDMLDTWVLGVGVPWASDDGYQTMLNSGYGYTGTPAMIRADEGAEGAIYIDGFNPATGVVYEDIKGWWILQFPEVFGVNAIIQERSFGKSEFWQMIMLDLAVASTGKLIFYEFPHQDISYLWPTQGGCDPTTFDVDAKDKKTSSFALSYVAKRPTTEMMGRAILIDGVVDKCTLTQAENYILSAQAKFINWLNTAIENVSVGKVFYQALLRNSLIRIVLSGLKGITDAKIRSKHDRWLNDAAKWFEDGTILVSSADTPFLNAFRRLMTHFFDLSEDDEAWDVADSIYHAMRQMPDVLRKVDVQAEEKRLAIRKKHPHPLANIGAHVGYGARHG